MSHITPVRNDLNRRRFLGAAAAALTVTRLAQASPKLHLPIEGDLPSLGKATTWINSQPLTANQLRGKVVLVNFWTYTCINWLRSSPYVRAWAEKYKDQGLVVIGVHTPEFPFEENIDNVRRAAKEMKIDYPVAIDNDYSIWRAFENEFWPALYFVDAKGCIRHHRFGEGQYEQSEIVIQELLRAAGTSSVNNEIVPVNAGGIEAPSDWANLQSPENYVGEQRTQNFVSLRKSRSYAVPTKLKLNHWALAGDWTTGTQAIVLNEAPGRIAYRFHARDLHLVMATAERRKPIRFRVSLDGQPPALSHGLHSDGNGYGTLAEPRLYQLIRQPGPITDRQFEIEFLDAGAEAFAFTFG